MRPGTIRVRQSDEVVHMHKVMGMGVATVLLLFVAGCTSSHDDVFDYLNDFSDDDQNAETIERDRLHDALDRADADRDGRISRQEFRAAGERHVGGRHRR